MREGNFAREGPRGFSMRGRTVGTVGTGPVKPRTMRIKTSRGATLDTRPIIAGLKSGAIGHLGLDV